MVKYKERFAKKRKAEGYLTLRSVKFFLSWPCELTPPLKPIRGIIKFKCLLSSIVKVLLLERSDATKSNEL